MKMKFLGKKGQGAMEYLMTYGWAILVVMIVGVVLWQLGIFNPPASTTVTKFVKIRPLNPGQIEQKADANADGLSVVFVNLAGDTVHIKNIDVNYTSPPGDCTPSGSGTVTLPDGTSRTIANDGDLQSGGVDESLPVPQDGTFSLKFLCANADKPALASGSRYELTMKIGYEISVGGFPQNRTETGIIKGPVI